jgi:glycosyltransferase involved in cell wall biosynthesis
VRIAVVIPALDEAETVEAAIASARSADEIVVVDGGSLDRTADRARVCGECRIDEQQPRRTARQHARVLLGREPPVERREHRAQARAGEQQDQHRGMIEAEPRDRVAATHAALGEHGRRAEDPAPELGIGDRHAVEADRDGVGREARVPLDPVRQVHP